MQLDWGTSAVLRWLLVVIALAAGLLIRRLYLATTPAVPPSRRRLLAGIRLAVVLLLLAAAAAPRLVRHSARDEAPVVAVVVDDSASMARTDAPGGGTRWRQAQAVVALVDSLRSRLVPDARLLTWRGNGIEGLAGLRPEVPPAAQGSDPAALGCQAALQAARQAPGLVLLVSDGNSTVERLAPPPWPGRSLPVVVGVGDPVGGPAAAITDLHYPAEARLGDRLVVQATIALRNVAVPPSLTVTLAEGDSVLARHSISPGSGQRIVRDELVVRPAVEGLHVYRLRVAAAGRAQADSAEIAVTVRARRQRLLVVAERPDWTSRFLLQAARQEPVLAAEAAWPSPRGWLRGDSLRAWSPPVTADGWQEWDGVVLLGWPRQVPEAFGSALREAVARGLGLIVVADRGSRTPSWAAAVADLLPVTGIAEPRRGDWLPVPEEGSLPPPGLQAALALAGASLEALPAWLPPLSWLRPAVPRPEGSVLMAATGRDGRRERTLPVIVAAEVAGAPVVWIGSGEIWRDMFWRPPLWRGEVSRRRQQPWLRFVGALLSYVTAGGKGTAPVALAGMRRIYRAGERPVLVATSRIDTLPGGEVPEVLVAVRPVDGSGGPGEATTILRLAPVAGRRGGYRGSLPALPPGRYRLVPRLAGRDTLDGAGREIVVTSRTLEEGAVRQEATSLRSLAAAWHGIYLDAGSASLATRLAPLLQEHARRGAKIRRTTVRPLWSNGWFLLAVVGLLALEWWLRRRAGML